MYVRASLCEVYNDRIMKGRSLVYTRVSRRIKSTTKKNEYAQTDCEPYVVILIV